MMMHVVVVYLQPEAFCKFQFRGDVMPHPNHLINVYFLTNRRHCPLRIRWRSRQSL
jgi:hypothetical protein